MKSAEIAASATYGVARTKPLRVEAEPHVASRCRCQTFGEYLDRAERSRRPYGPAALAQRGAYVEFDFSVRGYKNKLLPLRWQLLNARSGVQLKHSRDLRVKPEVNTDSGSWNVWIPMPRRARRMYVQIQLYNDAGTVPIGRVRTAEFWA